MLHVAWSCSKAKAVDSRQNNKYLSDVLLHKRVFYAVIMQ